MQFKVLATITALATLVAAVPAPATSAAAGSTTKTSKCDTGPIQCCQTVQKASESPASTLLGVLGIVVQDLNIPVGLTCSPISVIGVGGTNCAAQPVCCKNNNFNGVVAIGCTPINVGL